MINSPIGIERQGDVHNLLLISVEYLANYCHRPQRTYRFFDRIFLSFNNYNISTEYTTFIHLI